MRVFRDPGELNHIAATVVAKRKPARIRHRFFGNQLDCRVLGLKWGQCVASQVSVDQIFSRDCM